MVSAKSGKKAKERKNCSNSRAGSTTWRYGACGCGVGGVILATRNWTAYQQWHELLDALCAEQGHLDNMALADALCAASGNRTQAAFDTAVKNLRNWRQGVHIPQRRNFLLLGKILKIDEHDGLREHWNRLYGQAKVKPADDDDAETVEPIDPVKPSRKSRLPLAVGGGVLVAVMGAAALVMSYGRQDEPADPVASYEGIVAEYVRNVSVKVGESAIIHGARGNECGDAPSWESAKLLLPELMTGILTDGGVGTRVSRQCGGRIPARAILFTATQVGVEQISLYGDDIVIRVSK
jgi:hypothetical protein